MPFTVMVRLKRDPKSTPFSLVVKGPQQSQAEAEAHVTQFNPRLSVLTAQELADYEKTQADAAAARKTAAVQPVVRGQIPAVQQPSK